MSKPKSKSNQRSNARSKKSVSKPKKQTPFGDTGAILGKSIGKLFGVDGSGLGRWLGSGIGSIFGSGQYRLSSEDPTYNVLWNGGQIPQFHTQRPANIVCHREYLGDITGTSLFTNRQFPLNPGINDTFPWLSSVAQNYQEYRWHGLVFEFRSMVTDFVTGGAPGTVIMATNYNADSTAYATKQAMENSEYAVSVKPTNNLMHFIECAPAETFSPIKFIRTGPAPSGQDLRLYDQGIFQFASNGNPVQLMGELWVSYCVEFLKPILPVTPGGPVGTSALIRTGITAANPLGLIQTSNLGTLSATCTGTVLSFMSDPAAYYMITCTWRGDTAGVFKPPGISFVGPPTAGWVAFSNNAGGHTLTTQLAPFPATSSTNGVFEFAVTNTTSTPAVIAITFDGTGVFPTVNTALDIWIMQVDNSSVA